MPSIRFSNLSSERVQSLSKELTQPLAEVIGCPKDHLSFGVRDEVLYRDGILIGQDVVVYVEWFDRAKEIKAGVASIIDNALLGTPGETGEEITSVVVLFSALEPDNFYQNGTPLGK